MRARLTLMVLMAAAVITIVVHEVTATEPEDVTSPPAPVIQVITSIPVPPEPASMKFQVRESLCDDPNQKRSRWTFKHAKETRTRIARTCRALGNSKKLCDLWDVIVVRESGGQAGASHTQGVNEVGWGPMALSEKWHKGKWPGRPNPDFCVPENTALVMHEITWRIVTRYPTRNLSDFQAVFGGHMEGSGRDRRPALFWEHRGKYCLRLVKQGRGWGCSTKVSARDLGPRIPWAQRKTYAARVKARNDARFK